MRRSTRRRFETDRKQTRTRTFVDEARDETMRIIRALRAEQAQREAAAAEAPAVAPMATKTASPTPKPRKRPSWIGARAPFALRAAACAVVAVGVALFAVVGIAPTVDREHNIATASSPLLPYQRIQFDTENASVCEHPLRGIFSYTPVLLCLPGDVPDDITLTFQNTSDVLFSLEEPVEYAEYEDLRRKNKPLTVKTRNGKIWLTATYLTDTTYTELEEGICPDGWWWDPSNIVELIERLRNCEIFAETSSGERFAFTLNFEDYPTRQDILDSLYTEHYWDAGWPSPYFTLERKEDQ